jgi:hypothetical protein
MMASTWMRTLLTAALIAAVPAPSTAADESRGSGFNWFGGSMSRRSMRRSSQPPPEYRGSRDEREYEPRRRREPMDDRGDDGQSSTYRHLFTERSDRGPREDHDGHRMREDGPRMREDGPRMRDDGPPRERMSRGGEERWMGPTSERGGSTGSRDDCPQCRAGGGSRAPRASHSGPSGRSRTDHFADRGRSGWGPRYGSRY